jgi:hypothetical protein
MSLLTVAGLRTASLAALVLILAGCGGGGDSEKTAQTTEPPVSGGNTAPTIQGQPSGSVAAGQAYSFQPAASDANGDTLTFSVANLPAWASFNATTGRVSGTPTMADVATYNGITISVSDGKVSASLAAFSIAVTQIGSGSATLSWTPPTQNTDGSALTNLAGYRIQYGRSQNNLDQTVLLNNASLNRFVVEDLSSGTWFFTVVSVSSGGAASDASNIASKTIS